jgi:site-specific DNA-cytosine methylase
MSSPTPEAVDPKGDVAPLTIATDCSGIETPAIVLKQMGIPFRSLWVSETCEHALSFIRNNCAPERIDRDMKTRDARSLPKSPDIYLSGFPCQYASGLNVNRRADDERRGIYEYVLEVIELVRPKIFVLENVRSILTVEKGKLWLDISTHLDDLDEYHWDHTVLDPCRHADCPQSRPRWYCVGLRKDLAVRNVPWPPEIPLTRGCLSLIDVNAEGRRVAPCYWRMLERWGISQETLAIIEPNGAGRSYPIYGKRERKELAETQKRAIARTDVASCMVSKDPLPFVPKLRRHLTVPEMLRLQGFEPTSVRIPSGLTVLQVGAKLGNAMNAAVMRELLSRLVPLVQK